MSFDKSGLTAAGVYIYIYIQIRGLQTDCCVSVCVVIVERLVDSILGVKHGVAAFVIQFLECYYNMILLLRVAVDHTLVWSMEYW